MADGLGMRYAFLGTLETTHLNAEGFVKYCEAYSKTIYSVRICSFFFFNSQDYLLQVSKDFKPTPKFEGPKVLEIAKQLEAEVPLDKLKARREWRDKCLTKLSQLKKDMNEEWNQKCQ